MDLALNWLGYFEESWRCEEYCYHSDAGEKRSVWVGVKKTYS